MAQTADTGHVATGRYRGADAGDRIAERRARLIATALESAGTVGWNDTTVRGVCESARLNPRYFYESFANLDELMVAVFEQVAGETTQVILEALDSAPNDAHAKAHAVIGACVNHLTDDPRRARILFMEGLGSEQLTRRRLGLVQAMGQLVAASAREFYGLEEDSDPIGEIASAVLVGGITELINSWVGGNLDVSKEQLIDDMTALFVITGEGAVDIARSRAPKAKP
jgi:AcrR family transcriptional regulator